MREQQRKIILLTVALIAISLNIATFASAYPQMFQTTPTKARDFSAYYIGAWRLFHNPDKIYSGGAQKGDYPILPRPATFRYAPSFLLIIAPFLFFPYQTALVLFNFLQLILLPAMAIMVYRILRGRSVLITSAILVLVLLQPLPGLDNLFQTYRIHMLATFLNNPSLSSVKDTFSWSYYYNWIDGNAKVLTTFLVLGCFYFGRRLRPYSSGLCLGLAFFDPRFALISIPLAIVYNRGAIRALTAGTLGTIIGSNFLILYHSIGLHYAISMLTQPTGFYAYTWIPFYAVVGLTIINYREIGSLLKDAVQSLRVRRRTQEYETLLERASMPA